MSLGPGELLVCFLVALVVLGPDQLPKAARQIGKGVREFRKFSTAMQKQVEQLIEAEESSSPTQQSQPQQVKPQGIASKDNQVSDFNSIDGVVNTTPILPPDEEPPGDPGRHFRRD